MSIRIAVIKAITEGKVNVAELLRETKQGDALYILDDRTGDGWTILAGVVKLEMTKTKSSVKKIKKLSSKPGRNEHSRNR